MQYSAMVPSFSVSQVSDVTVWSGIRRQRTNRALLTGVPHSTPHISRPAAVFFDAMSRNDCRNLLGIKSDRIGSPFSKYAPGLNVSRSFFGTGGPLMEVFGGNAGVVASSVANGDASRLSFGGRSGTSAGNLLGFSGGISLCSSTGLDLEMLG